MMPAQYVGFGEKAHEGYHFIPDQDDEGPFMRIKSGPFGSAVTQSCPNVVKTLADDGHHLIVDEVLFTDAELEIYVRALVGHTVYFIGVMCDLKSLQERELLRGDRAIGLGHDQIARVHNRSRPYDFTVDTTRKSAFECAQEILSFMKNEPNPRSFG
jgi:chloramphenicol 3-O phosphotransferase